MSAKKDEQIKTLDQQIESYFRQSDELENAYWETGEKIYWTQHVQAMQKVYGLQAQRAKLVFGQ